MKTTKWQVNITLHYDRVYEEGVSKQDAKEMTLNDMYDDFRHGLIPKPKIKIIRGD